MSEPSGGQTAASAGVTTSEPEPRVDAGQADAGTASSASTGALLKAGPPPFTVPTRRIAWPQRNTIFVAPQGTRVEGQGTRAFVVLGEGLNFAFHVSEVSADAPDLSPGESETAPEIRDDGAMIWNEGDRWFFRQEHDGLTCWNPRTASHGEDDVAMMVASCTSAVRAEVAP